MFTEPPYTCLPIDDSQAGEARTYGGVRDALAGLQSRQPSTRLPFRCLLQFLLIVNIYVIRYFF